MSSIDTFSGYSPIINFTFYIGAIVCGMFFIHPVFLACAVVLSAAYYLTIKRCVGACGCHWNDPVVDTHVCHKSAV